MKTLLSCAIVAIGVANIAMAGSVSLDGVSSSVNSLDSYWTADSSGEFYFSKSDSGKIKYSSIEIHEAGQVNGKPNSTSHILADTITITGIGNTQELISTNGNCGVINIGSESHYAKDLNIKGRASQSGFGVVTVGHVLNSQEQSINIYADNAVLSLADPDTALAYSTNAMLATGTENKNCNINLNIKNSLIMDGDISNGFIDSFIGYKDLYLATVDAKINLVHAGEAPARFAITGNIYSGNLDDKNYDGNQTTIAFRTVDSYLTGKVEDHYAQDDGSAEGVTASVITKAWKQGTHLTFADGAIWNMTANSLVTDLTMTNGATVNVNHGRASDSPYRILEIINLKGNGGTFNMDIDASTNTENSDRLFVYGTFSGEQFIALNNVGASANGAIGTVLATVNDGDGVFRAVDGEGTLYYKRYQLDKRETADETGMFKTDWYLKAAEVVDPDERPTTSVETIIATTALNYHTWRNENDKLLQRMGELRHNGEELNGLWMRAKGTKLERTGTFGFENRYTSYELGYDRLVHSADGEKRYRGFFISYADGTSEYAKGKGDNDNKAFGIYQTQLWQDGRYLDSVLRLSRLDNDFAVYDTSANRITGSYDNKGVSLSVEAGWLKALKYDWYVEPQGQISAGYLTGTDYRTSNGITVDHKHMFSAVGRVGFNLGRSWSGKNRAYIKANVLHEFGGEYDVTLRSADEHLRMKGDFQDTWGEFGLGTAMTFDNCSHLAFDAERSTGGGALLQEMDLEHRIPLLLLNVETGLMVGLQSS